MSPAEGFHEKRPTRLRMLGNKFWDFPAEMKDTELVVLAACYTADTNWSDGGVLKSMIDVCVDRGADIAIGWKGRADVHKINLFLKTLFDLQATKDPVTGLLPDLGDSIRFASEKAKSEEGPILVVTGSGTDLRTVFLRDLPRYGKRRNR
ncbi:MAG: hypothetical protein HYY18_03295 [Planctomycetes bacterium]|nr:hypothetical protein [Planctomycetota bacterium]